MLTVPRVRGLGMKETVSVELPKALKIIVAEA
jgi:hypothetical protein